MSEARLDKLEQAIIKLTDKFSEFLAVESRRQERDKNQVEVNARFMKHIGRYRFYLQADTSQKQKISGLGRFIYW